MNSFKRLNLEFANGQKIRYNEAYLEKFCTELVELLSGEDYMRKISFAKRKIPQSTSKLFCFSDTFGIFYDEWSYKCPSSV